MFTFRMAEHSIKRGVEICEILQKDKVVGTIYSTEKGIKIVSRYLMDDPESAIEIDRSKLPPIPAILINLIR